MTVFHADLDNTLIYSVRHDVGEEKTGVEVYEGREGSFMPNRSSSLLKRVKEHLLFVPTTTRTEEQYRRIDLKMGPLEYALVCNGGVLLHRGQEAAAWYEDSLRLIGESRGELVRARDLMERDEDRIFEVRNIRDLFLFTKSGEPLKTAKRLKEHLDASRVQVFRNGSKVYVLPFGLDKGTAVKRFRAYIKPDQVVAAGDSEFDVPMLLEADLAYAPEALKKRYALGGRIVGIPERVIFSDGLLEKLWAEIQKTEK